MASDPWRRNLSDGLYAVWPVPEMVVMGARFRNGRLMSGQSQREVAARSGVSQTGVSRLERGLATGMSAERIIRIAAAIGPGFPFGFCPHHRRGCAYPSDPRTRSPLAVLFED